MRKLLRFLKRVLTFALVVCAFAFAYYVFFYTEEPDYANTPAQELTDVGGVTKYYYEQLESNEERHAYNIILSELFDFPFRIKVPPMTQEQLGRVYEALLNDNPELFFVGMKCTVNQSGSKAFFYPEYTMESEEYNSKMSAVEAAAAEFTASAGSLTDDYSIELAVHDMLADTCEYSEDGGSMYDALVLKKAACSGYSKATKYLLEKLGLTCYVMCGISENPQGETENHMWNVVSIGGNWYNLDVTWDDPTRDDGESITRYAFFNLTDSEIGATHSDFVNSNKCISSAMNYHVRNGLYFTEYNSSARIRMTNLAAGIAQNGGGCLELKFATASLFSAASSRLFDGDEVYAILRAAGATDSPVSYSFTEEYNIIEIYIAAA